MDKRIKSLLGNRYGKLQVIAISEKKSSNGSYKWICRCDCGNIVVHERGNLLRGHVKSCGKCRVFNTYDLSNDYGIGSTSKGEKFYFDKEDYEKIKKYNWSKTGSGYLISTINGIAISMHRYIMDAPKDKLVDHVNHNKLDNRKHNLRLCTYRQNNINKKCKGYTKRESGNYEVAIRKNGKIEYIGVFKTKEEALKARRENYDEDHIKFEYKEDLVNEN